MNSKHQQRYQIVWARVAEKDLKQIIEYIAAKNPYDALNILQQIKQKASSLYTLPERGRIVPELRNQGISQYRELIVRPWRIIYRVSEREIFILSVIDARQNVEDILLQRLINKR